MKWEHDEKFFGIKKLSAVDHSSVLCSNNVITSCKALHLIVSLSFYPFSGQSKRHRSFYRSPSAALPPGEYSMANYGNMTFKYFTNKIGSFLFRIQDQVGKNKPNVFADRTPWG